MNIRDKETTEIHVLANLSGCEFKESNIIQLKIVL